jgi:hypothetical protein
MTRRRLNRKEIATIRRFQKLADIGEAIDYQTLEPELKRVALNIPRDIRLVEKGILQRELDEDSGFILTVSLDADLIDELRDEIQNPRRRQMTDNLVPVPLAFKQLGISRAQGNRLIEVGKLGPVRKTDLDNQRSHRYIRQSDIDRFIEAMDVVGGKND